MVLKMDLAIFCLCPMMLFHFYFSGRYSIIDLLSSSQFSSYVFTPSYINRLDFMSLYDIACYSYLCSLICNCFYAYI